MKRMIIGIDATRANKTNKTGVEWYSYYLIKELAKLPRKHTYRLYFNTDPEPGLQNLGSNFEYRVIRWPFKYLWTQLRLSFEMLVHPPDLLFIPAQIIPIIHPAKTVTTIHDVAYLPYPESYSWKSRNYLDFAAKLAKKLPLILTVSEFSKKEITKYYGIDPKKIIVTPLGFSHETKADAQVVMTKYDIRDPYILYVGRLERKKNVAIIVDAFNLIKNESWGRNFELVLVGVKGYGWDEIEKIINASHYKADIKIVGWVTEAEKHTLLAEAKAFILLSAYEGFGIPLLEAMAARTPIITSNQAALPEIGGHATYIVPRGKPGKVRDALKDLLYNTGLRQTLIARGEKQLEKFSWNITAEKTAAALEGLLSSHEPL